MLNRHLRTVKIMASLLLVVAIGVSLAPALRAGKPKTEAQKNSEKPRLRLVADKAVGFTPVEVVFTARLTGVNVEDPNFCHAAVTWVRIDRAHTENEPFSIREDPVCRHPEEESRATLTYTKRFVLRRIGVHLIKVRLEGKDGRAVESAYTRVRVLRVH
ncbi:MAG: hypothetical protein O7A63_08335 [Acidobacteria bacterium]|nr:hypothetical protein [Acidobacteriota bacterium]